MLDRAERIRQGREALRGINERIARTDWADAGDSLTFSASVAQGIVWRPCR
jgi:hypothetical protein